MVAFNVKLDLFRVAVNSANIFIDSFANGSPPPALTNDVPGGSTFGGQYGTRGTFTETGGFAILDGANAVVQAPLRDDNVHVVLGSLLSANGADENLGLRITRDIDVFGRFDIANLTENLTQYGIRLSDFLQPPGGPETGGDDIVNLVVRKGSDGIVRVQLIERNFIDGTAEIIGSVVLTPGGAEQIVLRFHHNANTGVVTGSFFLVDNGVLGTEVFVPNSVKIFGTDTETTADDETWTRAQFYASGTEDLGLKFLDGDENANTITGTSVAEEIFGYAGSDTLSGSGGADLIHGGRGADIMKGGAGSDTYFVDDAGDTVTESAGSSNGSADTVHSSVSFTLGSNVENLVLIGTGNINGTGNTRANTITGNAGKNALNGGDGDDTYIVGKSDTVTELSDQGTDTVRSSVGFTLGGNVENLVLIGSNTIGGTGNSAANSITGNSKNNVINGKAGNDTLEGRGGKDTFVFDTALNASTNVDTITDYSVTNDTIRLENAVFLGLATGTLATTGFKANTTGNASDSSDRIIYETDTGKLFFDADGNGAGAKVHFATLDPSLALTSADFVIV